LLRSKFLQESHSKVFNISQVLYFCVISSRTMARNLNRHKQDSSVATRLRSDKHKQNIIQIVLSGKTQVLRHE
jgi:hypothetical protein